MSWVSTVPLPIVPEGGGNGSAALWATLGVLITAIAGIAIAFITSARRRTPDMSVEPTQVAETLRSSAALFDDLRQDIIDVRRRHERLDDTVEQRAKRLYEQLTRHQAKLETHDIILDDHEEQLRRLTEAQRKEGGRDPRGTHRHD